jgi:hypothetical protein
LPLRRRPPATTSAARKEIPVVTTAVNRELVRVIAEEMAYGVETAVECWMTQIELALADTSLSTVGRLQAVREVVENYKHLTGKVQIDCRRA